MRRIALGALATGLLIGLGTAPATAQADPCPNEQLRVKQGSTHLPDCRAYELVTPSRQFGQAGGIVEGGAPQIAPDGDRVAYRDFYALDGSDAGSYAGLLATRTETGWEQASILPPPGPNQIGGALISLNVYLLGSTPDARTSVYFNRTTEPHASLWVRRADGSRVRIADASVTYAAVPDLGSLIGGFPGQPWFQGISADGATVVFSSTDALVPDVAATGNDILYVWRDDGSNGGQGSVDVVNRTSDPTLTLIDPGASAALGGSFNHASRFSGLGLRNAISADGSRIFFQTPRAAQGAGFRPNGGGPLYLREGATTTEASAPAPGHTPASPPTKVQYLDASTDGAYAFFWADGDLTDDAPGAGGIYRYDAGAGALIFAAEAPTNDTTTAMASADGSTLYYQDGTFAQNGSVEVWTEAGTQTVFDGAIAENRPATVLKITDFQCATANVTTDGRYFAFTGRTAGNAPLQAYRYDRDADELVHVSTTDVAPASYNAGITAPACTAVDWLAFVSTRFMSEDGSHVFFETNAALVPRDNNGAIDVYGWHDGEVSLISTGVASGITQAAALFLGTDASGENAFFTTPQALVHADPGQSADTYTARINGGIPSQNETPPTPCQGDECQGEGSVTPQTEAPGSATHNGPGNASQGAAARCATERRALRQARRGLRQARGKARTLRRKARRVSSPRRAKRLRQRAKRTVRPARRQANRAQRQLRQCRRAGS